MRGILVRAKLKILQFFCRWIRLHGLHSYSKTCSIGSCWALALRKWRITYDPFVSSFWILQARLPCWSGPPPQTQMPCVLCWFLIDSNKLFVSGFDSRPRHVCLGCLIRGWRKVQKTMVKSLHIILLTWYFIMIDWISCDYISSSSTVPVPVPT